MRIGDKRRATPLPRNRTATVVVLVFVIIVAAVFMTGGPAVLQHVYRFIAENVMHITPIDVMFSNPIQSGSLAVLGGLVGGLLGSWFMRGLARIGLQWDRMEMGDKVTLFAGILAGLIAAFPLIQVGQAFDMPPAYRVLLVLGITLGLCSLCVYALQSVADILPWNRGRRGNRRSGIKILDTNVIIDGRVFDVARSGFLEGEFYVPRFVLEELQYIADSHDPLRRARGRRGLDVLKHMQADFPMEIGIYDRLAPDPEEEVDSRIVRMAKALGADIVTNDFNLNRVATLQELRVLSLNDLALSLRTNVLPEETIQIKIIREGNQPGQGIGYLDDGTMVVVENGQPFIGETRDVVVVQVIQTERGKMIFAEVDGEMGELPPRRRSALRGRHP